MTKKRRTSSAAALVRRVYEVVIWAESHLSWVPPLLQGVAIVCSNAFFALAFGGGSFQPGFLIAGVACGIVAIALLLLVEQWRRNARSAETAERVQSSLVLNDALVPALRELGRMSTMDKAGRARILERITGSIAASIPKLIPIDRMRVVFYAHHEATSSERRHLAPGPVIGRGGDARKIKSGDGARGDAIFAWLDAESAEPRFRADVRTIPGARPRSYVTYIAAPVKVGDKLFGMLAVDACNVGDLDENDIPIVEVFALVLADAYGFAGRA